MLQKQSARKQVNDFLWSNIQNKCMCKTRPVWFDFTSSTICSVTNKKCLSKSVYWCSYWKQVSPKLLLQVSAVELHSSMVIQPKGGAMKKAQDQKTFISDSALRNILKPQLKNMYGRHKVLCLCECWISTKGIYSYLFTNRYHYIKKLILVRLNDRV